MRAHRHDVEATVHLSPTISFYIARQFLLSFLLVFGLFIGVILLIDLIELLRRASGKDAATFSIVLNMAILKLPLTAQKTLPFAVLFGGMLAFWRLNRSSELIALRGSGVSVWQFLAPVIIAAALLGAVKITVINPLGTAMIAHYEQLENKYIKGQSSLFASSASGVWLRQINGKNQSVIHAAKSHVKGKLVLTDVVVLFYKGDDVFRSRLDAKQATLEKGYWLIKDAWLTERDKPRQHMKTFRIKTSLTIDKIQDSFSSPATISFWELPHFISALEATGFSTLSHRLHWHALLAEPMLYCAMILIAAVFSLRHNRRAGILLAVAGGIGTGFILFFVSDLILALGHTTGIPPVLAAWSPSVASALLGLTVLLHVEDG